MNWTQFLVILNSNWDKVCVFICVMNLSKYKSVKWNLTSNTDFWMFDYIQPYSNNALVKGFNVHMKIPKMSVFSQNIHQFLNFDKCWYPRHSGKLFPHFHVYLNKYFVVQPRLMFGDEVLGEKNIRMVQIAQGVGLQVHWEWRCCNCILSKWREPGKRASGCMQSCWIYRGASPYRALICYGIFYEYSRIRRYTFLHLFYAHLLFCIYSSTRCLLLYSGPTLYTY